MNIDNFIKIRVSADEMSAIKQRAEAANMNISSFIRNLALNGKIILYDTEYIYRFNQLMRSIGTNINQITTVVNSENKVFKRYVNHSVWYLVHRNTCKVQGLPHRIRIRKR